MPGKHIFLTRQDVILSLTSNFSIYIANEDV